MLRHITQIGARQAPLPSEHARRTQRTTSCLPCCTEGGSLSSRACPRAGNAVKPLGKLRYLYSGCSPASYLLTGYYPPHSPLYPTRMLRRTFSSSLRCSTRPVSAARAGLLKAGPLLRATARPSSGSPRFLSMQSRFASSSSSSTSSSAPLLSPSARASSELQQLGKDVWLIPGDKAAKETERQPDVGHRVSHRIGHEI